MPIFSKEVVIKVNNRTKSIYKNKYDMSGEYINVKIEDLPYNSNVIIEFQCDYCGKIFKNKYTNYTRHLNTTNLVACRECLGKKMKDVTMIRYGVENISQLDSVKKKKVDTCNENFGCDYPMQNKEIMDKAKISMVENYGVKHNFYREEIVEKVKIANAQKRFENGNIVSSSAQRHLCGLFNGILNYPVKWYNLDILLDNNIYCEYNGSGHKLNVKMGEISEEEYKRKDMIRYLYLKSLGYKEIIFDNYSDKLLPDNIMIDLLDKCKKYFELNTNAHWIKVNLDNGKITTKNAEIFYMIN